MKRALFVSYHWPPRAGVTPLRALSLATHLREAGWKVRVATGPRPAQDRSHANAFPEEELIPIPGGDPHAIYQRWTGRGTDWNAQDCLEVPPAQPHWLDGPAKWIRGNLFFPDARMSWIPRALARLRKEIRAHRPDVLFSSGPPHSNTWVAHRLSRETGVPWVADFQDPWVDLGYYRHLPLAPWARWVHRRMERAALHGAAVRTCTSPSWSRELASRGLGPVHFVPWGYTPAEFPAARPTLNRLCVGGTLGPNRHYPWFWETLARRPQLEIRGAGNVAPGVQGAAEAVLGQQVRWLGPLPRQQWLGELATAGGVVVLANRGEPGRVPAKFFEATATGVPVLVVGDAKSDVGELGKGMGHFAPTDPEALLRALDEVARDTPSVREKRRKDALSYARAEVLGRWEQLLPKTPPGNPNKVDT